MVQVRLRNPLGEENWNFKAVPPLATGRRVVDFQVVLKILRKSFKEALQGVDKEVFDCCFQGFVGSNKFYSYMMKEKR